MANLTQLVCIDSVHADALIAELNNLAIPNLRWDSRRVLLEMPSGNVLAKLEHDHFAYTDSHRDGKCTLSKEQIEVWEKMKGR